MHNNINKYYLYNVSESNKKIFFEQSLYNRSVHQSIMANIKINTTLLKYPHICMRFVNNYDKEKTVFFDFCGNPGDDYRHFKYIMDGFILLHANVL